MEKQIDLGNGYTVELTPVYRHRVAEALVETINLREKELGYLKHLQDHDLIAFYDAHISRLQEWLS